MIDRRTFLKLSAGALVLTAAGALTGCGDTEIEKTSGVAKIGDVTYIDLSDTVHHPEQQRRKGSHQAGGHHLHLPGGGHQGNAVFQAEGTGCRAGADGCLQRRDRVLSGNQGACAGKEQSRHLRTACALQWSNRCVPLREQRQKRNGQRRVKPNTPRRRALLETGVPGGFFVLCRITGSLHWGWHCAQSFTHFLHVHGRGRGGKAVE